MKISKGVLNLAILLEFNSRIYLALFITAFFDMFLNLVL